jgi:hypothetical protein
VEVISVLASISSDAALDCLGYRRNLLNLLQGGVGGLLHLAHRLCRTRHLLRNRLHRLDNRAQALRHFGGDLCALLHGAEALLHRLHGLLGFGQHLLDDGLDFARGVRAALRQTAHLFGNDRKPAPRLARARRFNRRVQGKQVRLTGNLLNRLQNPADGGRHLGEFLQFLGDLAGLLVYAVHHGLGELEGVASLFGDLGGVGSGLLGLLKLVEGLADACGDGVHLLDARAGGLRGLFGALGDLAHDAGDLVHLSDAVFGGVCGLLGAAGDLLGGLLELGEGVVGVLGFCGDAAHPTRGLIDCRACLTDAVSDLSETADDSVHLAGDLFCGGVGLREDFAQGADGVVDALGKGSHLILARRRGLGR